MKTRNLRTSSYWLVLCILLGSCLLSSSGVFAQSETNNMITYDTIYNEAGGQRWAVRITRPANMFTANHPDTASRPAIIMMPGVGEAVDDTNQQKANARKFGPHYWLASGQWDGGVQLANGKHYPILITVVPSYINPRGPAFYALINFLVNRYHIKRNAVHGTGLSMGAFTWTKSMVYEASAGAETFMKLVTSITALQGASNETFSPYSGWSLGWDAFGRWAEKYNGKFFGLEGTNDSRQVWKISQNMNSAVPGSAYFAFENIGGGAHCCWNDMYSPFRTNWSCVNPLGANIAVNTQIPNTMGTYVPGSNVFQWMLRQGDTTLVGSAPPPVAPPAVSAGSNQAITLPTNTAQLTGTITGELTSSVWTQVSGPNTATIVTPANVATTVSGLVEGSYVFKLSGTNSGGTNSANVAVTVNPESVQAPVANAGTDQFITLPTNGTQLAGTVQGTVTNSQWTQVSGPNTAAIVSSGNLTTDVNNLIEGVYIFKLTATNTGGTHADSLSVTVNAATVQPPSVNAGADQNITLPANSVQLSGTITGELTSSEWSQVSGPNAATIVTANNLTTQVNGLIEGVYVFELSGTNTGGTTTASVTVTVSAAAVAAPVITAGTDQTIVLPTSTAQITATVQGTVTSSEWTQLNGPNTATIVNATDLTTNVNGLIEGVYTFRLIATNSGGSDTAEVTVTVNAAPVQAPVVTVGSNQTITLPTNSAQLSGTIQGTATSSEWTQESGPNTASIVDAAGLTTDVNGLVEGVYVFKLTATNSGGTNSATVTITVNAAVTVQPPVVTAGTAQTITLPDNSALLTGDIQGSTFSIEWTQLSGPNTASIVNATNASTAVNGLVEGVYTFRLIATNSGGSDTATVTVTVNPEPVQAPIVDAGINLFITLPINSVELTGTVVTGQANNTEWEQVSGPNTATIADAASLTTQVNGLAEGVYTFRLIATNSGGSDTATITVTVNAEPVQPPVASAGTDQTITLPENTVQLTGTAQGQVTTTEWIQLSGPGTAVIVNASNLVTDVNGLEEGIYVFKLIVSNSGGEDTATVTVTVNPEVVPAPVVNAGADQTITLPTNTFQLTGSVLGEVTSSMWSQLSGPNTATIANTNDIVTNASGLVEGVYVFRLTATNEGGTSDDTITITVNPEPVLPPVVTVGADQVITLPTNSVQLTGTVQGQVTTTVWTQVSGPNTATLSNAGTLTSDAGGLIEGVYVFQLAATNSGGSGTANITVTVKAANTPPTVTAGSDQLVTLPANSVQLTGIVQGQVTSTAWTQVSGPNTASIATAADLTTIVNGLVEGVYVFKLSATNSAGTASANVSVTVNPAPVTPPTSGEAKVVVGLGEYQAYFIDSSKHLWGVGNISNIGTNGQGTPAIPRRVSVTPLDLKFKAVIGGLHGGAAIDEYGNMWVMGDNDQGQHGQGDVNATLMPRKILVDSAGNPFTNIVAGTAYFVKTTTGGHNGFFAIKADGTLWVWGRTLAGMRGNGTDNIPANSNTRKPVQVIIPGGRKVKQIVAGNFAIALCTDGTVWTWGQTPDANLGYSATGMNYASPHMVPGLSNISQIAGSGSFNYALSSNGILYGWGTNGNQMCDMTYPAGNGLTYPTPRPLTNITNKLPLPIKKIVTNTVATHVILEDGSMYGWGLNSEGAVGVGSERIWSNFSPQYAWDFTSTPNELVKTPTPIAPTVKFADVFGSNVYTFYTYAIGVDGQLYCWGRNKASVLAVQIAAPNPVVVGARQSAWNRKWPTPVNPFSITTAYISTSPDCVAGTSSGSPCNSYAIPSNTKPVAKAGTDQTVATTFATLNGTGSTDNVFISYYEWKQISGPNTAIINLPASKTPRVSNLVTGVYKFQLKVTDNGWLSDSATVQVAVNASIPTNAPPVANAGQDKSITLPVNTVQLTGSGTDANGTVVAYQWTKLAGPSQYAILSPTSAQTVINNLVQGVYKFELKVTDDEGAVGRDTVTVNVNAIVTPTNQLPIASAGPDRVITLPVNNTTLAGSGSDPDGTITAYQWSYISGPTQYNIVSATQAQTAISGLVQGVYRFVIRVTDNQGATAKDTVTVTVNAGVNQSPIATPGPNRVITLPVNTVTLNGTGSDPDGTIATFHWSYVSGPAQYAIVSPNQAQTVINNLVQGVYRFELRVTDNLGAIGKDTITITVNASAPPTNQAPVAYTGANLSITLPANTVSVNGNQSYDPDGTVASYLWTKIAGPTQFAIASPAQVQTAINNLVQGVYQFELRVTDNQGAIGRDTMTITVNAAPPANQAPIAFAGTNLSITLPVNTANLNGSGSSDPDGTIASYLWTKIAGPAQFAIASPALALTAVNNLVQGTYSFELRVTDNKGAVSKDTMVITVNPAPVANQLPVAIAGNNVTVSLPLNSTTVNGSGSYDPDGAITAYQWTKIAGPGQYTIVSPTQAQTVINNLVQGVYQFELRVTDNKGVIAKDTLSITVNAANHVPVANAGNNVTITLPTTSLTINGSSSYDSDGTITAYQWTKIAGPAQFTIVSPTQKQTLVNNLVQGVYKFELKVTDNQGAIGKDTVTVTVNQGVPANQLPVANVGNNIVITLPLNLATVNGSSSYDPDGTIAAYQWTKIAGPSQFTITAPVQKQTTITNLREGIYKFELRVTDNQGGIGKDTVTITVNPQSSTPNQLPVAVAGEDQTITIPVNSVQLDGSGSHDPDGQIISYSWTLISGPSQPVFVTPNSAKTEVNNLVAGEYKFLLRVVDNKGAESTDEVIITVLPGESSAKVYPNPAVSVINLVIESNTQRNNTDVQIFDARGNMVHHEQFIRDMPRIIKQIDVSMLAKGVYFIKVQVDINHAKTVQFLKQ